MRHSHIHANDTKLAAGKYVDGNDEDEDGDGDGGEWNFANYLKRKG